MIRWTLEGLGFYVAAVLLSCLVRRDLALVPRLISAAWVVAGLKYASWFIGISRMIWSGACTAHCALSWTVLTCSGVFIGAVAVALLTWRGRDDIASLIIALLAGNLLLWEVFEVHLIGLRMFPLREGYLFLSIATLMVLGPWALWRAFHDPDTGDA